ncbi:MAG: tetratricopeptide repeat protein [Oscillospiraceae bacterium]|nr:tetratricopeptide repeat protein [Oscillospiraceae bacterium]
MAFTQGLNNIFHDRDLFLEMIICETLSSQLQNRRSQEAYNEIIEDSEYFYAILGNRVGEYTVEEFDTALESYREKGAPRIYVYFQKSDEPEKLDDTVHRFAERLEKDLQHYYNVFTHIDSVKLNLLIELCRDPRLAASLALEDGEAKLNGIALLSMANIPLYGNNEVINKLRKEKEELEIEFSDLIDLGQSEKVQRLIRSNTLRRNEIADKLHVIEKSMLDLCQGVEENRRLGRRLNWREKKAMEFVDAGDYESAKAVLRDEQWHDEVLRAEDIIKSAKNVMEEYICGKKTLIHTIMASGLRSESEEEVIGIYEEICLLAAENQICLETLYEYADFLLEQNRFSRGRQIAEKLTALYTAEDAAADKLADAYWMLGRLYHWENDRKKAEHSFRQSLSLYRELAQQHPNTYEDGLAKACNNLANLLADTEQKEEAETLYREAMDNRKNAVQHYGASREPAMARSCYNLAVYLAEQGAYEESEQLHLEAMKIRSRIAESDSMTDKAELARSYYGLGELYIKMEKLEIAEEYHMKAYEIRSLILESNPSAIEPDFARSCYSIGNIFLQEGRYDAAEQYLQKAADIRKQLADENPKAFSTELEASVRALKKCEEQKRA